MENKASMTKRVGGVGRIADAEDVPKRVAMKFVDKSGRKTKGISFVEIADTDGLRRKGLSKRASIGQLDGMLFDCRGPFWMKDVEFPLDLCYMDGSGRVTEKVAMAKDKAGRRLYPATKAASAIAIELPSGYCDRFGITVGDRLRPISTMQPKGYGRGR